MHPGQRTIQAVGLIDRLPVLLHLIHKKSCIFLIQHTVSNQKEKVRRHKQQKLSDHCHFLHFITSNFVFFTYFMVQL